jgi:hypothetical protein
VKIKTSGRENHDESSPADHLHRRDNHDILISTREERPREEWRPIPGVPGYEASSLGRIKAPSGNVLAQHTVGKGGRYLRVRLSWGRRALARVHRLVAMAFYGPPPSPRHHAAHWNDRGHDNRASNIRWATARENAADRMRNRAKREQA